MKLAQIFITPHQYIEVTIRVVGLLIVEKGEVGMCLMYYIKYDSRVLYVREVFLINYIWWALASMFWFIFCLNQRATTLESNCHCLSFHILERDKPPQFKLYSAYFREGFRLEGTRSTARYDHFLVYNEEKIKQYFTSK